ncbi:MAG: hypothetical protein PVF05_03580 [Gemmatimonadales bacterium]|jgi:hypothetical protein
MQVQIRRISTASAFLVGMALYGLIGFLVGIALVVVAGLEVPAGTEPSFVEQMGVWAIVIVPLAFGLGAGFVTAVAAALYNTVTSVVGGIRVELRSGRAPRGERKKAKRAAREKRAAEQLSAEADEPKRPGTTEPETNGASRAATGPEAHKDEAASDAAPQPAASGQGE